MKKDSIVRDTLILTVITLIAGLLLGLVYQITKEPIAASRENRKQEAYHTVFQEAETFQTFEAFEEKEAEEILRNAGVSGCYVNEAALALDSGENAIGSVVTATSKEGYGGEIKVSVGITLDGTVTGIELLSISETAGLGMNATKDDFKNQFKDKKAEEFKVTRYHSLIVRGESLPEEYQVDAVSKDGAVMGISHKILPLYGVQFHPEAVLTEYGHELLENFCKIAERFQQEQERVAIEKTA